MYEGNIRYKQHLGLQTKERRVIYNGTKEEGKEKIKHEHLFLNSLTTLQFITISESEDTKQVIKLLFKIWKTKHSINPNSL